MACLEQNTFKHICRQSVHTLIFVIVKQALKFGMEDLQMFLDKNFLADACQHVVGAFV